MQEEEKGLSPTPVEDLFMGVQESFAEAQQRSIEENKSFAKTEYFRMDKLGVYRLRVLPLAPNTDGTASRPGYEYSVHQLLLELDKPVTNGKPVKMYVTVPRATDAGYSIDIIDTYRQLAVSQSKERGDDALAEKINGGSFGGGLRYNYGHALYVYDLNERMKGIQLLTLSHSQYKDLDERRLQLWQKKLLKSPGYPCPISSVYNAYPVEITKRKHGNKTEYLVSIDNESDTDALSNQELTALLNAPRIPEIIYRYTRYQLGATVEFLKQRDTLYHLNLMENEEMKSAIEKLGKELSPEDVSEFSFDQKKEKDTISERNDLTLDDLFEQYDDLQRKNLSDKTEEGIELRTLIRTYIEQEGLSIRVTRSMSNKDLLDQIEATLSTAPDFLTDQGSDLPEDRDCSEEHRADDTPGDIGRKRSRQRR